MGRGVRRVGGGKAVPTISLARLKHLEACVREYADRPFFPNASSAAQREEDRALQAALRGVAELSPLEVRALRRQLRQDMHGNDVERRYVARELSAIMDWAEDRTARAAAREQALAERVETLLRLDRYLLSPMGAQDTRKVRGLVLRLVADGAPLRLLRVVSEMHPYRGTSLLSLPIAELAAHYRAGSPLRGEVVYKRSERTVAFADRTEGLRATWGSRFVFQEDEARDLFSQLIVDVPAQSPRRPA